MMDMAALHPEINYIGIERYSSVLLRALQKMEQNPLPNLRFMCIDAADIEEIFAPEEVDRIYLNFSDPWPKDRHAKRRLTSSEFLNRYDQVLSQKGRIEFKTDNRDLFDFSLEEFRAAGYTLENVTFDLHASEWAKDNIVTEYEANFSAKGFKINRLEAFLAK